MKMILQNLIIENCHASIFDFMLYNSEKENPFDFFHFSFRAIPHFYLINDLVYFIIIHKIKMWNYSKWKTKKYIGFLFLYKYGKFRSILLGGIFISNKLFFSEQSLEEIWYSYLNIFTLCKLLLTHLNQHTTNFLYKKKLNFS